MIFVHSVAGSGILFLFSAHPRMFHQPRPATQIRHCTGIGHYHLAVMRCTIVAMLSLSPECYKACTFDPSLVQTHRLRTRSPDVFSTKCFPADFRHVSLLHCCVKEAYNPDSVAFDYAFTAALGEPVGSSMWGLVVVSPFQIALLVYDTLLTFSLEVKYIWRKKIKIGSILYVFARYPTVFVLLAPFLQFQTIKVSYYSARNIQSSHKYLVRVSSRSTMSNVQTVHVTTGLALWILSIFYHL